jgi:hypothetical protein
MLFGKDGALLRLRDQNVNKIDYETITQKHR